MSWRSLAVLLLLSACMDPIGPAEARIGSYPPEEATPAPPGDTFPTVPPSADAYDRETPHSNPAGALSRYVLYEDSSFELQYVTLSLGCFAYRGTYSRSGDTLSLLFADSNTAGPWTATATLEGPRLAVKYNIVMWLADFEDGAYTLRREG